MVRISEKDMMIIERLMGEGRIPFTKLAKELGVTEAAVRKRIRKLEEMGIIKGYKAVVDPKKIGYNVVALIGFDVEPEVYVSVIERVKKMEEVKRMFSTTGDHMIMVEGWFKNNDDMMSFVKRLESIPGVSRVCPAILVEEIK